MLAVALFTALSLIGTYPLITDMAGSLAGLPNGDQGELLNAIWWAAEAVKQGISPADFRLLAWPHGYFHPVQAAFLYPAVAALPFSLPGSPVLAYNASVLAGYVLAGLSAWWLCREVSGDPYAALVGGVVFGFLPTRVAHVTGGHLGLSTVYLFPAYAVLLIRLLKGPVRRADIFMCGLLLALCMMVYPVYPVTFVAPLTLAIVFGFLPRDGRRAALARLGGALAIAAVLLAPFYGPLIVDVLSGEGDHLAQGGSVDFSASLFGFFSPSPYHPFWGERELTEHEGFFWENEVYLGLIALGLSALAVRSRKSVPWMALGLVAVILALGPYLKIGEEPVSLQIDDVRSLIPMPHALLSMMPVLGLSRAPARFTMTAGLAMAVLASIGAARILEVNRIRKRRAWVAVALSAAVFTDSLIAFPFPVTPVTIPDGVREIADVPGAVANVPARRYEAAQLAMLYQTVHGRPMTGGYLWRNLEVGAGADSLLSAFAAPTEDVIPVPSPQELAELAGELGVTTLIALYYPSWDVAVRGRLESALGTPEYSDETVAVFDLRSFVGEGDISGPVYAFDPLSEGVLRDGAQLTREFASPLRLFIYMPESEDGQFVLGITLEAGEKRLRLSLNGEVIAVWEVPAPGGTLRTPRIEVREGINEVVIEADDPLGEPDCRCWHTGLTQFRFVPGGQAVAPHHADIALGDSIRFLGYDMSPAPDSGFGPGDEIDLVLYWQAIARPEQDYMRFVHLAGPDGAPIAQSDGHPIEHPFGRARPTSTWEAGEIVMDEVRIVVPEDVTPGTYRLRVGMYSYPSLVRLPIMGAEGDVIELGGIEVR